MAESFISKTQKELGDVIAAPKLTDKLLSKPPFRFLHDVVTSFLKATGFPDGLYSSDMLDSSNVTEREKKIQFLTLLAAAVEAATGQQVAAQPSKIVAGHEPEHTNQLLQLLAACAPLSAEKKAAAVRQAKGMGGGEAAVSEKVKEKSAPQGSREGKEGKEDAQSDSAKAKEKDREREREKERRREKEEERERRREKEEEKERERKHRESEDEKRHRDEKKMREKEREREREKERADTADRGPSDPPVPSQSQSQSQAPPRSTASAGKAPPRPKPTHEVVAGAAAADASPAPGVIREGRPGGEPKDSGDADEWMRVAEQQQQQQQSQSHVPREGEAEARGYLGQQALQAKREQEESARQQREAGEALGDGGIVIHSKRAGRGGGAMAEGELSKLREQLQLLTKASNPLGKLLEAIHDDIDTMTRELEMWRSEARNQMLAAADARRQTLEGLQEVQAQVQNIEDAITDQILKTHNIRRNVINNDNAIAGMVRMIVSPYTGTST